MSTLSRLIRQIRPHLPAFLGACLGGLGVAGASWAQAELMKTLVDDILVPDAVREVLLWFLLGLFLAFLVKGLTGFCSTYLMAWVGQSIVKTLRDKAYQSILFQSLDFFHRNPTGHLISRLTYDVSLIQTAVSTHMRDLLQGGLTIFALVVFMFYTDWQFAVIALGILPPVAFALQKFSRRLRRTSKRSQEQVALLSSQMHESGTGIRIVKAFQGEKREQQRFEKASTALRDAHLKAHKIQAMTSPLMEIFGGATLCGLIAYAFYRITSSTMTAGEFMAFFAAMAMMYAPLKRVSNANNALQQALVAAQRVFEVIDEEPKVRENPAGRDLEPLRKSIHFESVSFSYNHGQDAPVLREIELEIPVGEVVALVGESGAGKSTLVSLLPRFYDPDSGRITFDGTDTRDVTTASLRKQIGIVTQETLLFNDTIRANIAYGRPEASEEEIVAAARAANAHGFIEDLPEGYDTSIGELGGQLSGGQRQRLAIARALLKNPPVLILDEPTSNLDSRSESLVQEALSRLMQGRTVFLIAHRLSTVQGADRIIVMDQGRVVETGHHAELLEKRGHYARLHEIQFANA